MQNIKKLPHFKKQLNSREKNIVDYLISKQGKYISTRQISQDTGVDYRGTCDVLGSLYNGLLVFKKIKKYYTVVEIGGRRNESFFSINMFAVDALNTPLHCDKRKSNKDNFLIDIKKRDKTLFNKIFDF